MPSEGRFRASSPWAFLTNLALRFVEEFGQGPETPFRWVLFLRRDASLMTTLLPPATRWLRSKPHAERAPTRKPSPGRICAWYWTLLALVLVAGITLFYRLGSYRSFSSHEVYAVVTAREMIESQNWVLPTFGGLPRLRKPPLVYWVVAGSAKVCGELSPVSARLPSALAGLLLAGVIGLWAKRWYGPRVGWAAVFVQLTSIWFLIFARKAEIDMLLCLFTTTALFLIADQPDKESSGRSFFRWLSVYVLLSLAWLAKFHYGPAMVLVPALLYFVVERRWRLLRTLAHPIGLFVLVSAIAIWPALVLEYAPNAWEIWRKETLGRAVGELGNHPITYYLPYLLWLPLPWTPFALASIRRSWKAAWRNHDSKEKFLWIWFLSQLAIVTLSANKHQHYLLALLPMCSLLAARSLSGMLHGFREGRMRIHRHWLWVLIGLNLAFSLFLMLTLLNKWPELKIPILILAITVGVCEGLGWLLLYHRRVFAVVAVNVLSVLIGGVVLVDWLLPRCDRRVNVLAFAKDIRQSVLPNESVVLYRMDRDPLVYHLGTPVFRAECLDDLKPKFNESGPIYVLGYEKFIEHLYPYGETRALARLPKGRKDAEPLEGDLVLVKILPRGDRADSIPQTANAN